MRAPTSLERALQRNPDGARPIREHARAIRSIAIVGYELRQFGAHVARIVFQRLGLTIRCDFVTLHVGCGRQQTSPLQIVVKLNVLAAWIVCLEPHRNARENLELPRVRRFYQTGKTIRSRAARAESNLLRGGVDNPDGARLLPHYM